MSTSQSQPSEEPLLREWAYHVQLIGHSWAGTYGNSAFIGAAGTKGDGNFVKQGGGQEGRITGGVLNARTEAEVREQMDALYIQTKTEKDAEGNEQEIVTQSYRVIYLEPRTVISLM